ncbi:YezD family protein [Novosphingobium sp. 9]|uniref:YezD family protein n=1 Tax=Novosphingobium sp. 9 TaxID=2025349 RepID=UPI0021B5C45A|nr:YezD family protein [Novosphingobium sp. 9]
MQDDPAATGSGQKSQHVEESLATIREALLSLRYGTISLTVHEDRVVQIDVTEKRRLRSG